MRPVHAIGAAVVLALAGCDGAAVITTDFLPVEVGNSWVYAETGGLNPGTVTKTISETETYLDQTTYVLTTTQTNSLVTKRSNWSVADGRVTRLRQQRLNSLDELINYREYDPGFLRLDGELSAVDDVIEESHLRSEYDASGGLLDAVTKTYTWTVEAVDEEVTVTAGTFTCLKVHRVDSDTGEKTYWYAEGVGKVLETDGVESEALSEYTIAGD